MLTVNASTAANTLTESAATVNAERAVTCTTAGMTLTENAASVAIFEATVSMALSGLGAITSAVESDHFSLFETGYASSTITGEFDFELHETAIAGDETFAIISDTLTSVVNASDSQTHEWVAVLADNTVNASNVLGPVDWHANIHPSSFKAKSETEVFLSESITATLTATDSFAEISLSDLLEDNVVEASEVITGSQDHSATLSSTIGASSSTVIGLGEALTTGNVVNASDSQTVIVHPQQLLVDTATVTDSILFSVAANEAVLTSIVHALDEIIIAAGVSNESLHETAYARDVLWAKDFEALAWVMNLETTGLSTYNNFGFNSIAAHDGVLYATSPEGVFALDGDTDDSRAVSARLKTGMLDFDIETKKRISDIFVGYTGGSLSYTVETYNGPKDTKTYEMPEKVADAPRNSRVKPGKGLSSRYWRFTVENIDGGDFQLHDQTAVVGASNRRL